MIDCLEKNHYDICWWNSFVSHFIPSVSVYCPFSSWLLVLLWAFIPFKSGSVVCNVFCVFSAALRVLVRDTI